jgi:cell division protein FtsB
VKLGCVLAVVVLAGAVVFSLQGGEFSTLDYLQLRREEAEERRQVAVLERMLDSLEREATAIERDPAVQERVARESFGMIRRGEFLYRLVPDDAAEHDADPAPR